MYDLKFADIGEGIQEGQILKWYFKVGDEVKEGETLVVIETDKVNAEIPSPVDGIIKKLGADVGEVINVGETLVLIDDGSGDDVETESEDKVEEKGAGVVGEIEVSDEVIASDFETETKTTTTRILATPVARKLAADLGIDITKIKGSGENNRVMKSDILEYSKKDETKTTPTTPLPQFDEELTTRVKISRLRDAIVKAMTTSKANIPHTTLMNEIDITDLVTFRNEQKDIASDKGIKLTYMPFLIKAISKVLTEFPLFNSSFYEQNNEIVYKNYFNVGIAVDTEDGLIVPNIKHANTKSVYELATIVQELATKANDRTLSIDEIQDGTFTITNYGALDATFGTPIIKHPEVAILGIGRIHQKPLVIDGEIAIRDVLPISLAVDHRIIDGADAGRFLIRLKELLSNPMLLLLS